MLQRIWNAIRQNPGRVALALAVLIGLTNTSLITSALLNQSTTRQLTSEVTQLTESLTQLREVEQEGLRGLEQEAIASEDELMALEAAFPNLGEPFDIYRQAFALAKANRVEILGLTTGSSSVEETPVGLFEETSYQIDGVGEYSNCVALLRALEQNGLDALALNEITLDIKNQSCDFEVVLANLGPLTAGADFDG